MMVHSESLEGALSDGMFKFQFWKTDIMSQKTMGWTNGTKLWLFKIIIALDLRPIIYLMFIYTNIGTSDTGVHGQR